MLYYSVVVVSLRWLIISFDCKDDYSVRVHCVNVVQMEQFKPYIYVGCEETMNYALLSALSCLSCVISFTIVINFITALG